MKRFTKVMAIVMICALFMSVAAIAASAESAYTPVVGTTTTFKKF